MMYTHWALEISNYGASATYLAKAHLFDPRMKGSKDNVTELYITRQDAIDAQDWLRFRFNTIPDFRDIKITVVKVNVQITKVSGSSSKAK